MNGRQKFVKETKQNAELIRKNQKEKEERSRKEHGENIETGRKEQEKRKQIVRKESNVKKESNTFIRPKEESNYALDKVNSIVVEHKRRIALEKKDITIRSL